MNHIPDRADLEAKEKVCVICQEPALILRHKTSKQLYGKWGEDRLYQDENSMPLLPLVGSDDLLHYQCGGDCMDLCGYKPADSESIEPTGEHTAEQVTRCEALSASTIATKCGHVFHRSCFLQFFLFADNAECPLCKCDLSDALATMYTKKYLLDMLKFTNGVFKQTAVVHKAGNLMWKNMLEGLMTSCSRDDYAEFLEFMLKEVYNGPSGGDVPSSHSLASLKSPTSSFHPCALGAKAEMDTRDVPEVLLGFAHDEQRARRHLSLSDFIGSRGAAEHFSQEPGRSEQQEQQQQQQEGDDPVNEQDEEQDEEDQDEEGAGDRSLSVLLSIIPSYEEMQRLESMPSDQINDRAHRVTESILQRLDIARLERLLNRPGRGSGNSGQEFAESDVEAEELSESDSASENPETAMTPLPSSSSSSQSSSQPAPSRLTIRRQLVFTQEPSSTADHLSEFSNDPRNRQQGRNLPAVKQHLSKVRYAAHCQLKRNAWEALRQHRVPNTATFEREQKAFFKIGAAGFMASKTLPDEQLLAHLRHNLLASIDRSEIARPLTDSTIQDSCVSASYSLWRLRRCETKLKSVVEELERARVALLRAQQFATSTTGTTSSSSSAQKSNASRQAANSKDCNKFDRATSPVRAAKQAPQLPPLLPKKNKKKRKLPAFATAVRRSAFDEAYERYNGVKKRRMMSRANSFVAQSGRVVSRDDTVVSRDHRAETLPPGSRVERRTTRRWSTSDFALSRASNSSASAKDRMLTVRKSEKRKKKKKNITAEKKGNEQLKADSTLASLLRLNKATMKYEFFLSEAHTLLSCHRSILVTFACRLYAIRRHHFDHSAAAVRKRAGELGKQVSNWARKNHSVASGELEMMLSSKDPKALTFKSFTNLLIESYEAKGMSLY